MCCNGSGDLDYNAIHKDKSITEQLANDKKRMTNEIRLLLLGAGESGKSTILKQMKIIHMGGFNPDEQMEYIPIIHGNIYESVQAVVNASDRLNIPLSPEIANIGKDFLQPFTKLLTPQIGERIQQFWTDEGVLEILDVRHKYQLLDNTFYFMNHIPRICSPAYVPTTMDILQARAATTGVTETSFLLSNKKFILVDVGGQRSERKKWIHVFEDVTGVIFCVGISAFDQTLFEDNTTNRTLEALSLFREICGSKWFSNTALILFLNKSDLFKIKLEQGKSISVTFPDFTGGSDYDSSIKYLREKFTDVVDPISGKKRYIYCHVTNATDTENVRFVFESVRDFIITNNLKKAGIY